MMQKEIDTKNKNDEMKNIEKNLKFLKDNNLVRGNIGNMNNGSQISQYASSKSS
jgi:hypothetical protein